MSGPTRDETICYNDTEQMASHQTVRKLRELADYVEEPYGSWEIENQEHIAELLRLKADKIEVSLRVIENQTQSGNFKELLKAIQWTRSNDYVPDNIQDEWDQYAEEITIRIERDE